MNLQWTEHAAPSSDCHYDNVKAATPFGEYRITWKSWKDYTSYGLDFQGEFVLEADSLEDAKRLASEDFEKRLQASAA